MTACLPVITWHSVDEKGSVLSTSPELFCQQLRWLDESGLRGVSLADALADWHQCGQLPERAVALTFDDGFGNFVSHAMPALQAHDFGATLFITSDYLGRDNMMGRSDVRLAHENGFEIGAHTVSHPDLRKLSADEARGEMEACKNELEDLVSAPVENFAYPFGYTNSTVTSLAEDLFRSSCTTRLGYVRPGSRRGLLNRMDAWYLKKRGAWVGSTEGRMAAWWKLRQLPRDLKDYFA